MTDHPNSIPPKLGQYFAGRCMRSGIVVILHYIEPHIRLVELSANHKSSLACSAIMSGVTNNNDFMVGVPGAKIVAAHVSVHIGSFYLQGGVGNTPDEAVEKLVAMCSRLCMSETPQ
jgi:uncharacterized protein (DUF2164 family)